MADEALGDLPRVEPVPVRVDVWVDVTHPWCHIGKRRLEAAIARSEHPASTTVVYHAAPPEPVSPAQLQEAAIAGRPDGVVMVDEPPLDVDTDDALRIVELGLELGGPALQSAVLERLFVGVFAEGRRVDDAGELTRMGAEAGLDERVLAETLAGRRESVEVEVDRAQADELGVSELPHVVVDGRITARGPASIEDYLQVLTEAARSDHPDAPAQP